MASKDDIGRVAYGNYVEMYQCRECGHIFPYAFDNGRIYRPCHKCGGKIVDRIARKIYQYVEETVTKRRFIFWKVKKTIVVKKFVGWQMK